MNIENGWVVLFDENDEFGIAYALDCLREYEIFNNYNPNRDKLPRIPAHELKMKYPDYIIKRQAQEEADRNKHKQEQEEKIIAEEKARIANEKKIAAKKKRILNKKPIRKILIKDGEHIDLVITKDICIGKNKVKGIEVVQRVKVNLGQAIIPMDRNKLATVDFIINKIGDAIL